MKMKNYLLLILICMSFVANAQSNTGYASFIGDKFQNLKMASGETYDKGTLVAGHRTLPYGTQVKVTNSNNGLSVIVTIKDRGPFVKGEIIEISRTAGEALGMIYDKKAPVRIEVVGAGTTTVATTTTTVEETAKPRSTTTDENTTKGGRDIPKEYNTTTTKPKAETTEAKPAPAKSTWKPAKKSAAASGTGIYKADILNQAKSGYGVQIGVFSDLNGVIDKITQLKAIGFTDVFFTIDTQGGKTTHRVIIGNYPAQDQADAYKKALRSKYKLDGFVVDFSEL
jgi:rare lipoprotein A